MVAEVRARAGAELEEHRLGLGEVHDRGHRVLHRVDEAGRALRLLFDAHVEPDRAVEGHLLVDDQVRQLGLEGLQVLVGREVVLGLGPGRDRVDDPVDELADARLALRRADVAAEVLADHDVGRELAPEAGDLDVLLLEDELARLVADARVPELPRDLVVGMDARAGPAALEVEAGDLVAEAVRPVEAGLPWSGQGAGAAFPRGGSRGGRACAPRCGLLHVGSIHDRNCIAIGSGHCRRLLHRLPSPGLPRRSRCFGCVATTSSRRRFPRGTLGGCFRAGGTLPAGGCLGVSVELATPRTIRRC